MWREVRGNVEGGLRQKSAALMAERKGLREEKGEEEEGKEKERRKEGKRGRKG